MNAQRIHERQLCRLGVARPLGSFRMPEASLYADRRARSGP